MQTLLFARRQRQTYTHVQCMRGCHGHTPTQKACASPSLQCICTSSLLNLGFECMHSCCCLSPVHKTCCQLWHVHMSRGPCHCSIRAWVQPPCWMGDRHCSSGRPLGHSLDCSTDFPVLEAPTSSQAPEGQHVALPAAACHTGICMQRCSDS